MSPEKPKPSITRTLGRRLLSAAACVLALWLFVGVVLHITGWRDRFDGFSVTYYTTPWPVLAAGLTALALHERHRRRPRTTIVLRILAVAAGLTWVATSWYCAPEKSASADFRVVLWNVRNNPDDLDAMAARIRSFSPGLVALAEAGTHRSSIDEWRKVFPEYKVERLPQQMLLMNRTGFQRGPSGILT
ncbi:MAG: hypothetical protein EOP84_29650, partial [Verrucomicrobiaceae bacterium]